MLVKLLGLPLMHTAYHMASCLWQYVAVFPSSIATSLAVEFAVLPLPFGFVHPMTFAIIQLFHGSLISYFM